jgi:hypothetical protein
VSNRKFYNTGKIKITCSHCEHLIEEMAGVYCYNRPESIGEKTRIRAHNNDDICPSIIIKPKCVNVVAESVKKELNIMIRKFKERGKNGS